MFVMLYNNFVNPTHLIYCYQRVFFFRGFGIESNLFVHCLYLFIHVFIYFGEEKGEDVEMLY